MRPRVDCVSVCAWLDVNEQARVVGRRYRRRHLAGSALSLLRARSEEKGGRLPCLSPFLFFSIYYSRSLPLFPPLFLFLGGFFLHRRRRRGEERQEELE